MLKTAFSVMLAVMAVCWSAQAIERSHGILAGTVLKVDAAAKTVVVKVADGTEHVVHVVARTAIYGARETAAGVEHAFHGLKEGSEVAVHYTAKGTVKTADEIDTIGKDGLKATEATVTHLDRGAKTLAVNTADGAEETFRLTDSAAKRAGKDIAAGAEKSGKVTLYYTDKAGHKVVRFFKRAV
jgi:hypothetical protein